MQSPDELRLILLSLNTDETRELLRMLNNNELIPEQNGPSKDPNWNGITFWKADPTRADVARLQPDIEPYICSLLLELFIEGCLGFSTMTRPPAANIYWFLLKTGESVN